MKLLVTQAFTEKSQQLIDQFQQQGHDVWCCDWRFPEKRIRNFVKINPLNFEAINLLIRLINPEEIHNIVSSSYLANIHILMASGRIPRVICYFTEESKFLDKIAQIISEELGFSYENRQL